MTIYSGVNTRVDIAKLCGVLGFKEGAEIGVCKGKFSRVFCWNVPNIHLYCIDAWESNPNDPGDEGLLNESNYAHAKKILEPFNITFLKTTSMDAVSKFKDESLDFVYIDANHTFDYIMEDIIGWSRKVKIGGIVSGHDYFRLRHANVILAVDTYTKVHGLELYTTTDDHTASWFFIKE
jgi:hypothetical protein